MRFQDRAHAGRELAVRLGQFRAKQNVIVLALPRGGVPVGFEIAKALDVPLDVFLVRKLGVPGREELAMGAVASGGIRVLNDDVIRHLKITPDRIEPVVHRELKEIERQQQIYQKGEASRALTGRTVILVDDGLATGSTMRAAIEAVHQQQPQQIIVAVPVGSAQACAELTREVDELVCLTIPDDFLAVALWYEDFTPISDQTVSSLLQEAGSPAQNGSELQSEREVEIATDAGPLAGTLTIPRRANSIVLFAHGSGSSRLSPRNRFVAESLQKQGLATLLIDLLSPIEARRDAKSGELRFNISLLADRVRLVTDWLTNDKETEKLSIGYFGASTGAAAALVAAAQRPDVAAVVSRGGRPDLAGEHLSEVHAATLLIVGERDYQVIELNRQALDQLQRSQEKQLIVVPRATHLFEEPGTLERVAELAGEWFVQHLQHSELTNSK
jgi:putative phosphoribosyl transferase